MDVELTGAGVEEAGSSGCPPQAASPRAAIIDKMQTIFVFFITILVPLYSEIFPFLRGYFALFMPLPLISNTKQHSKGVCLSVIGIVQNQSALCKWAILRFPLDLVSHLKRKLSN